MKRRSSLLLGLIAALLMIGSVQAQPAEQVVMDVIFWTWPVPVTDTCIELPGGQLAVTIRLDGGDPPRPVSFSFGPDKNQVDTGARFQLDAGREPVTWQGSVIGGRYCYALMNRAIVPSGEGVGSAGASGYTQRVAVRMALTPP